MTTISDKTASTPLELKKPTAQPWLNITLVILLAGTMLSLPHAHAIHCVSGLLMLMGCSIHLVLHRRWIKAVILDTPGNITPALRLRRRLFWGMLVSGFFCGLSGLGGILTIHNPHIFLPVLCLGAPIHILSGISFLGFSISHVVLHRNWFMARMGRKPG